jgi:hypothetical protein
LLLLSLLRMLCGPLRLLQVPPEDAGGPRDLHKRHVRQWQAHAAVLLVSTQKCKVSRIAALAPDLQQQAQAAPRTSPHMLAAFC